MTSTLGGEHKLMAGPVERTGPEAPPHTAAADEAGAALIDIDASGLVVAMNGHAAVLLHQEPREGLGWPVAAVVPLRDPGTGSLVPPPVLAALRGATQAPRHLDLYVPGRAPRPMLVEAFAAADGGGATLILRDTPRATPARAHLDAAPSQAAPGPGAAQRARDTGPPPHLCPACTSLVAPGRIDRALKLHLLLVLFQHWQLRHDALSLSDWLKEPPWEVQEALSELADAGLLGVAGEPPRPTYSLEGSRGSCGVSSLARAFEDPELRQVLLARLRSAEQERAMRQAPPAWEFLR